MPLAVGSSHGLLAILCPVSLCRVCWWLPAMLCSLSPPLSPSQLSRHNKSLQQLLKPVKRIQEEEEEGISSMVRRNTAPAIRPDPRL